MKPCIICHTTKSIDQFYKHPQMGDGHLNKCKDCTKKQSHQRFLEKNKDPIWREKELQRHRDKKSRPLNVNQESKRAWHNRNLNKYDAHKAVANAIKAGKLKRMNCIKCGEKAQAHHDDYSKPLDVIWLCPKHHSLRHVELRQIREYGKVIFQPKE